MIWKSKRCIILDMDGTVYLGDRPIPGAVSFIQKHWEEVEFYFLTNNTSKSRSSYEKKLQGMGIPATKDRIISPVFPLREYLRGAGIDHIYLVGNQDFASELRELMPEVVLGEDGAQAVVLAYDTELTYEKLVCSAHLLQKGLPFLATHPDLVCPDPEGPLPDVGSMLCLYEAATGRKPDEIFGKPSVQILKSLIDRFTKREMIMVGDRLRTDMMLAHNAGIDFALVLSGEAKYGDTASFTVQPTCVLTDLGWAEKEW